MTKRRIVATALLFASWLAPVEAGADMHFFPLPMYATDPNEGSTFGVLPVFMMEAPDGRVESITAPSLSWNRYAGFTGTYRYYQFIAPLASWHFIAALSTHINRSLWFQYDDDRRDAGHTTKNIVFRVRQNLFYRFFGLGPDTTPAGQSSYTRLTAIASTRWGWNLTRNFNVAVYGEARGDRPEAHAIASLPETQLLYPNAPGLGGATFIRQGLSLRYDTREGGDYADRGFDSELSATLAEGLSGVGVFGQFIWNTHVLLPETRFLQLAARIYWNQVVGSNDIPFYDQASLGGELLLRGFQEDRFIDKGAWEAEAEERIKMFETHLFGVVADWRVDPFVAVGQVYGLESPWAHIRYSGGVGIRLWIKPDILGRVDVAYGGEGLRAYVLLGYPY
jgi:hypothetical protein